MDTRTLKGLSTALVSTGCVVGAVALLPVVDNPALSRAGILLAIASIPAWTAAAIRQARDTVDDRIADAHVAGYQLALDHIAEAAADPGTKPAAEVWGQRVHTERHDR